jgi:hypothetical protein
LKSTPAILQGLKNKLVAARAQRVPLVTIRVTVDGQQLPLTLHTCG